MNIILLHTLIVGGILSTVLLLSALVEFVDSRGLVVSVLGRKRRSRQLLKGDHRLFNALSQWPGAMNAQTLRSDERTAEFFIGRSRLDSQLWKLGDCQSVVRGGLFLIVALIASSGDLVVASEPLSWSEFQNGGTLVLDQTLPTEWSPDSDCVRQVDLEGYGQSTPVIHGEKIFVTTTQGENKETFTLAAYSLKNGGKLWRVDFENPTPEKNDNYVSRAAPTPVVDAEQVVVLFEGGVLAAVSHDGKETWKRNLVEEYGPIKARHGLASSLVSFKGHAIAWVERMEEPYILCFDRSSGETIWKAPGLGKTTWSTPRLISVGDGHHLVCSASGLVVGLDPQTGDRVWELSDVSGNSSPTPMAAGDAKFFVGASGGRGEPSTPAPANSNGMVEIKQNGDGEFSAEFVWRAEKANSSFGSPIVAGDRVYEVNRSGVLYGLDSQTGKQEIQKRSGVESIWATPLISSGKLYLFGRRGDTSIVDLATHQVLATNKLWEAAPQAESTEENRGGGMGGDTLYAATVAGQALILRRGDKLYIVSH